MIQKLPALLVEPFDVEAYDLALATALTSKDTRVFLDTSTLVWLYRLHDRARKEVLLWLTEGPQAGNVRIPRRALLEFSRHRRSKDVLLPFRKQVSGLPSLMEQMEQWAHLITDDALARDAGFASRAAYLAEVRKAAEGMTKLTKPVRQQAGLNALDAELIPIFNQLALDTDIYRGISDLQREYEARSEIRMPPGFEDRSKGGRIQADDEHADELALPPTAGANRFGDFAIWREILEYCRGQGTPADILILTHDQKKDWSYTPLMIAGAQGQKPRPNAKGVLRVTAAHPLLAHEARLHGQAPELFIITTPQLASVTSKHATGASLSELARAVQIEVKVEVEAEEEAAKEDGSVEDLIEDEATDVPEAEGAEAQDQGAGDQEADVPPNIQPAPPPPDALTAFLADLPPDAAADRLYAGDRAGSVELETAIAGLKSSSWYTQNPATEAGIRALRAAGSSMKQGFVFGRNLYQAACGSAGTPIAVLNNLEAELAAAPDSLANAVYSGALFEAYFDKDGAVRREPKSAQLTALFSAQVAPRFATAVAFIRNRLRAVESRYLLLPDPARPLLALTIVEEDGVITGIRRGEIDLIVDVTHDVNAEALPGRTSYERLRDRLARHFALPKNQFVLTEPFEGVRPVRAGELRAWGPHTDIVFPAP